MLDISTIKSKLIGISFLRDRDEQQTVKKLWQTFSSSDAFWVDAAETDSAPKITKRVIDTIRSSGAAGLHGSSCVVALFLDFSGDAPQACIPVISGLSAALQDALFCTVSLELQYVYIGRNPVSPDRAPALKPAILSLTQNNAATSEIFKRTCLIAKTMIQIIDPWNPAVFYLDLLRRNNVGDVLPTFGPNGNDDVCFIRFAEFDGPRYNALQQELVRLNALRGAGGESELKEALDRRLKALATEARNRFALSAKSQPLHPDLQVTGCFNVGKAKRGKNALFSAAQKQTINAVQSTAQTMAENVKSLYNGALGGDARKYLDKLLQEVGVGVELIADRARLADLFEGVKQDVAKPLLPLLTYNKSGYETEIQKYFDKVLSCASSEGEQSFLRSLRDACASVSDEDVARRRIEINQQIADTFAQLERVPSETAFVQELENDGAKMLASFMPIVHGGMTKRLIVDGNPADATRHENMVGTDATVLLLPQVQAAMNDAVNPKALQLLSFDCDATRLDDLIKEVEM